ncbi:MAG TPA: hypothetical protein VKF42_06770 [Chitinivibrionales bacterium]|jgi:tetratricopeptide (TPR) repeat protein|nr:hypothetical protein [Chitinivibrionales bacterium]
MKIPIVNRDSGFYPLAFGIWAIAMVATNGNHSYFGTPLPAADVRQGIGTYDRQGPVTVDLGEAQKALAAEKNPKERAKILETIGSFFFDRYRAEHSSVYLDSAQFYVQEAIKASPGMPENFYNLARIFTEKKDFASAQAAYEKILAVDPKNFMACHNLGLLSYYEMRNPVLAQNYFEKALSIDTGLPIDNFLLARIAAEKKDFAAAARHYRREMDLFAGGQSAKASFMADQANLRLAATLSALELSMLYSTAIPDRQQAQTSFESYLKLETDQQRRQNSTAEFQKRWQGATAP